MISETQHFPIFVSESLSAFVAILWFVTRRRTNPPESLAVIGIAAVVVIGGMLFARFIQAEAASRLGLFGRKVQEVNSQESYVKVPNIVITQQDADRLDSLLENLSGKDFPGKEQLQAELTRASIVNSEDVPSSVSA